MFYEEKKKKMKKIPSYASDIPVSATVRFRLWNFTEWLKKRDNSDQMSRARGSVAANVIHLISE